MDKVLEALSRSELVLTPTKRLARELAASYNREQIRSGVRAWDTPRLLPWQAWLVQLEEQARWSDSSDHGLVLNTEQARLVWEKVLHESGLLAAHVPASSMVGEVMRAYRTAAEYRITIPAPEAASNDNIAAFSAWVRQYDARLREKGWIDPARIPDLIGKSARSGLLAPETLSLIQGDELCTLHKDLLTSLADAGWTINILSLDETAGDAVKVLAENPDDEIELAARWARQRLQSSPNKRLAVIVSDLAERRDSVARTFTEVLAPELMLPGISSSALPFHLSIGKPLAEHAMVSQALALLEWVSGETGLPTVSRVLRAQYLAPEPEAVWQRADLEARLRSKGWRNVELASAVAYNRESKNPDPGMEGSLGLLAELPEADIGRALPSVWAERFNRWLAQAAWPGYRPLDSMEYQVFEAWKSLLGDFSRLDQVTETLESTVALGRLKKLARDKVFQAEAGELPVQIMDPREAQGLHFDGAWMTGWTDEAWPQPSQPSPFLPIAAQVAAAVPGAGPDQQYLAARTTFGRLEAVAPECVFSWAGSQDERPMRPSALISDLETVVPELADHEYYRQVLQRSGESEDRPVAGLPEIPAGSKVSGGIQVIERQSVCPFRAYAQHRLKAEPLESPGPGIDARERGTRVHRAMDAIWKRLKSHQGLCVLEPDALGALVEEEVEKAFDGASVNTPGQGRGRLIEMERKRVSNLVAALMNIERDRPPFTVEEREQGTEQALGGLVLSIRPDRVDVLPDGRQMILDYKTGKANPGDWFKERPQSVQMPVYLVARESRGQGAMFVTLSAGNVMFAGALADEDMMQGDTKQCKQLNWTKASGLERWEDLLIAWRERFIRLAEQFRRGEIQVDPADNGKVCQYCHLQTLCRVTERGRAASDEE